MIEINNALLWQHNQAKCLTTLLQKKQEWYDQNVTQFWKDWTKNVFDLKTTNDFGMSVWEKILDIKLDRNILDFDQRLFVLQLKYFSLTTRCNLLEINSFLEEVSTGFKQVYLVDNGGMVNAQKIDRMEMTYFISNQFTKADFQAYLLEQDILPRPEAVHINFALFDYTPYGYGDNNSNYFNGKYGTPI